MLELKSLKTASNKDFTALCFHGMLVLNRERERDLPKHLKYQNDVNKKVQ